MRGASAGGKRLRHVRKEERLEVFLAKALAADPKSASAHHALGMSLKMMGQNKEAVVELEKFLLLVGADASYKSELPNIRKIVEELKAGK
ncbi:MAG: hypothetical protein AABY90_07710 [Nitrospirota bacterium]